MEFSSLTVFSVCAVCLGVALGGCEPSGQNAADDEKEPHFVLGLNRVHAMDYSGAVDAFEQSLEANPHSAPAHYKLAMLYSENITNPAAAIYHYQQYLRFDPKAPNADIVKQWINICKQQLAADVMPLPSSSAAQQQLQQLADKNRQLQDEVDYYVRQLAVLKTNATPVPNNFVLQPKTVTTPRQLAAENPKPPLPKPRTHTVVAGETPAAIARKLGVNLDALLAANPGLQPAHMRIGQVINLPPP
jgi:LysM repeat protein